MSADKTKSFEEIKQEVTNQVTEYENQREVCLSLREFLNNSSGMSVWAEPVIRPLKGGFKTPDLLLAQNDWLVLDYKEITSKEKRTLEGHIKEMAEYTGQFKFHSKVLEPEVAIICPIGVASAFSKIVNTIPVLGCHLGRMIKLKLVAGSFKSKELASAFRDEVKFPFDNKLTVLKFLRHEPQSIAYTAEIVRTVLWQMVKKLGSEDRESTREELTNQLATMYPPYLRSEKSEEFDILQVTAGRVDKALQFMKKIDFIDIRKSPRGREGEDLITASKNIRPQETNFIGYFIEKEAELRFEVQEKERRKHEREEQRRLEREARANEKRLRRLGGQKTMDDFRTTH